MRPASSDTGHKSLTRLRMPAQGQPAGWGLRVIAVGAALRGGRGGCCGDRDAVGGGCCKEGGAVAMKGEEDGLRVRPLALEDNEGRAPSLRNIPPTLGIPRP